MVLMVLPSTQMRQRQKEPWLVLEVPRRVLHQAKVGQVVAIQPLFD